MKLTIIMKTPNALHRALEEVVKDECIEYLPIPKNPSGECIEWFPKNQAARKRLSACKKAAAKWIRDGEYVTIEIDTDDGSAIVLPAE